MANTSNCSSPVLPEDFRTIISHEALMSSQEDLVKALRSPQKGWTTWVRGDSWALEDNTEIFLDMTDEGYYEELIGEVFESCVFQQANLEKSTQKGKSKCIKVLVCPAFLPANVGLIIL
ncbi:hypothetical protein ARMSODRAFT_978198 [Armillaria solidipes]|uniref:Uncharacterized protein n=1 Tax=Armillaria solidipes TaxID=1076256 RepID=A0A2H3B4D3_9AGAR|nr:hypothetical protein ARMSODRAFT_978198 [Armillaria solidipes]